MYKIVENDVNKILLNTNLLPLKNKSILITGASGLLGIYFVSCLRKLQKDFIKLPSSYISPKFILYYILCYAYYVMSNKKWDNFAGILLVSAYGQYWRCNPQFSLKIGFWQRIGRPFNQAKQITQRKCCDCADGYQPAPRQVDYAAFGQD